jgi:hypothetical protein
MTNTAQRQQQFLVTWYHPTEYAVEMNANHWVIGSNDDFGYEIICALLSAQSEEAAMSFVRESYTGAPVSICIRSCQTLCGPVEIPASRRFHGALAGDTRSLQAA